MRTLYLLLLIFLLPHTIAHAQTKHECRFVDFHIHVAMKAYYRNVQDPLSMNKEALKDANWTDKNHNDKIRKRTGFSPVKGKKSYNQATYDVLEKSNASILCASLYALEKQSLSEKYRINICGVPVSMRNVNKLAVTMIPKQRQSVAYKRTGFEEYKGQVEFLEDQLPTFGTFTRPIKIAEKASDFEDKSTIWIVITAEGGHNFYGLLNSSENSVRSPLCVGDTLKEILDNVKLAKNINRLFFVTPSHLFWNKISGYARGLDMDVPVFRQVLAKQMWKKSFSTVDAKWSDGIISDVYHQHSNVNRNDSNNCECIKGDLIGHSDLGYAFIDALLDAKDNKYGKPTYIDMRHMDVRARLDYIKRIHEKYKDTIPLIVSHAAVNGKSQKMAAYLGLCPISDNYREYINPKAFYLKQIESYQCGDELGMKTEQEVDTFLNKAGWFHPMSNNLFDEEIRAIYNSKGIIGLTLDGRALGKNGYNYRNNKNSLRNYFIHNKQKYNNIHRGSEDQ